MKKTIALCLCLCLCFLLIACGQSVEETEATTATETTVAPTAPVTEPPTELPKEIHWTEEFYVDDFGDPTSSSYIRGIFDGTFSNSATTGSYLTVCFFMDKNLASASYDMFTIRLLEYGNHKVSFIGCDEWDVSIKVKVDGVVSEDEPYLLLTDSGEMVIDRGSPLFSAIIDALEADKEIAFVITVGGYGTDTYRFNIDANGLADIPHNWKGKM